MKKKGADVASAQAAQGRLMGGKATMYRSLKNLPS